MHMSDWAIQGMTTHEIVKGLNLNIKPAEIETCWVFTEAKAEQKNVVQFSLHKKSQVPGESVFLDLSSWSGSTTKSKLESHGR